MNLLKKILMGWLTLSVLLVGVLFGAYFLGVVSIAFFPLKPYEKGFYEWAIIRGLVAMILLVVGSFVAYLFSEWPGDIYRWFQKGKGSERKG